MSLSFFFFFNDTATTEIYTLSLHDALPISGQGVHRPPDRGRRRRERGRRRPREAPETDRWTLASCRHEEGGGAPRLDRKSTRLNSSHGYISYAVFCLKKKIERTALLSQ